MSIISSTVTWYQRSSLRRKLLAYSDRNLADMGFSRALLEEGMSAYPWREPVESIDTFGPIGIGRESTSVVEFEAAAAALHAMTDAELQDLALTRGTIEDAVRYGRPGFPESERKAA